MIKQILVALDPDSDTPVATQYAIEIAQRYGALVTGLAVVDVGSIESSTKGGGVGSMYYAEKLRENLTEEAREHAQKLAESFRKTLEQSDVPHAEIVEEGVPFERIVEDVKYNDLLILGNDPHFFYSHPKHKTHTLARVVERTITPMLVVTNTHREVKKVLVALDKTKEAARAIRRMVHLAPFGHDLSIQIVNVHKDQAEKSRTLLNRAKQYFSMHELDTNIVSIESDSPPNTILDHATRIDADLIVMGAHTKTGLMGIRLGDTTSHLLKNAVIPLFVDH